ANPVNMFVASFIGSPAMSLVPLELTNVDGRVAVASSDGWHLLLSERNARKVAKATSNKIVLGARHSTIKLHKSAGRTPFPPAFTRLNPPATSRSFRLSSRELSSISACHHRLWSNPMR